MEKTYVLNLLWMWPLLACVSCATLWRASEKVLNRCVRFFALGYLLLGLSSAALWFFGTENVVVHLDQGFPVGAFNIDFAYSLLLDGVATTFILVTTFCGVAVAHFSSYYLHGEPGYARFFSLIFLLIAGMSILAIANSLPFNLS